MNILEALCNLMTPLVHLKQNALIFLVLYSLFKLNNTCYLYTKVPVLIRSAQGCQMLISGPVMQKIEDIFIMIIL